MPVLRLSNVAPEAAHDLGAYLNQDSFEDIVYRDGTLSGTWNRLPILTAVQEDGSYQIDVPLTDTLNETLYFTIQQSPDVLKGFMYRRETSQAILDTLFGDTYFKADGTIDTQANPGDAEPRVSWNLNEKPAGRTVLNKGARRDDAGDLQWDVDVEIIWHSENAVTTNPSGAYDVETWSDLVLGATSLPTPAELEPNHADSSPWKKLAPNHNGQILFLHFSFWRDSRFHERDLLGGA